MKLIKINTDHYIIVDDSEIKKGDWTYHHVKGIYKAVTDDAYTNQKKIIHSTQPLELLTLSENGLSGMGFSKVRPLNIFNVKKLIGEVDVEKKAELYVWGGVYLTEQEKQQTEIAYMNGYNQALEDNKEKKYTEEDISKALSWGYHTAKDEEKGIKSSGYGTRFIQSLQPKTEWKVEWETIDNRQPCHCQCHNNPDIVHFVACCNNGWIGKITQKLKLK